MDMAQLMVSMWYFLSFFGGLKWSGRFAKSQDGHRNNPKWLPKRDIHGATSGAGDWWVRTLGANRDCYFCLGRPHLGFDDWWYLMMIFHDDSVCRHKSYATAVPSLGRLLILISQRKLRCGHSVFWHLMNVLHSHIVVLSLHFWESFRSIAFSGAWARDSKGGRIELWLNFSAIKNSGASKDSNVFACL